MYLSVVTGLWLAFVVAYVVWVVAELVDGLAKLNRMISLGATAGLLVVTCGASVALSFLAHWDPHPHFYDAACGVSVGFLIALAVNARTPRAWSQPRDRRAYVCGVLLALGIATGASLYGTAHDVNTPLVPGLIAGPLFYSGFLTLLVLALVDDSSVRGAGQRTAALAARVEAVCLDTAGNANPGGASPRGRWRRLFSGHSGRTGSPLQGPVGRVGERGSSSVSG